MKNRAFITIEKLCGGGEILPGVDILPKQGYWAEGWILSIKKAKQEGVLTPSIVSEERNEGQVGVAETIRGGGGQDETTVGVGSETGGETFVSRKRALEIEASKKNGSILWEW